MPVDPHGDEDDRGHPGTPARLGSDRSLSCIKTKEITVHLKFWQHLPCMVRFPKPATYNGTKANNHIYINDSMAVKHIYFSNPYAMYYQTLLLLRPLRLLLLPQLLLPPLYLAEMATVDGGRPGDAPPRAPVADDGRQAWADNDDPAAGHRWPGTGREWRGRGQCVARAGTVVHGRARPGAVARARLQRGGQAHQFAKLFN
jgi:hypothetical protein